MSDRPSTPEILRDWGHMPIPVDDDDQGRRARIVSRVARTIRETADERLRARKRRRLFVLFAAAAAVALLLVGARGLLGSSQRAGERATIASITATSNGVVISRAGRPLVAPTDAAYPLEVDDAVSSVAGARADLRLASGVTLGVAGSTHLTLERVSDAEETVRLELGEVSVQAPPLGARSFALRTPDARVVIRGTRFVVRVTKHESGTRTEVSVTEGKVAVHYAAGELLLLPGQRWSSTGVEQSTRQSSPSQPAPTAAAPSAKDTPPTKRGPAPGASAPSSTPKPAAPGKVAQPDQPKASLDPSALAEQNKLYSAALGARDRGDDRAAIGHLDQLLARYPQSPLAPEARVERFRALKRLGKSAEAAKEARRYLLEQRDGAAREEARDVALEPKK